MQTGDRPSYADILRSSALMGATSMLNAVIGVVRVKAMAVLLGPAAFGLLGLYAAIADVARSLATLGVNSSGVRQIAAANAAGDLGQVARTTSVLRRVLVLLGVSGAALLVLLSDRISRLTFGDDQHAASIAILALAVLLGSVAAGQGALVQGMRRIGDLAKMGVIAAFCGTALSIPLVYVWREDAVVASVVGMAAASLATSWWYSRRLRIPAVSVTRADAAREAGALLKLGFAFMTSGFLVLGAGYAVNVILARNAGLEAAGLYQCAWTVAGLYLGFILQSMGADFYPRLVGKADDNAACNRLVNEQAYVSLLLAGPGVIGTLTFAPLIIGLLYSERFLMATEVLRWLCLGMMLRVVTWPMGFIVLAKGSQRIFLATEIAWAVFNVGLAWWCIRSIGLSGAGIAFFASYALHWLMIYPAVRWLSGFRWSALNARTALLLLTLIALVFCGFRLLPPVAATVLGGVATLASAAFAARQLARLLPSNDAPPALRRLLALLQPAVGGRYGK
jgi:PST family polysaccharide transporter